MVFQVANERLCIIIAGYDREEGRKEFGRRTHFLDVRGEDQSVSRQGEIQ